MAIDVQGQLYRHHCVQKSHPNRETGRTALLFTDPAKHPTYTGTPEEELPTLSVTSRRKSVLIVSADH
jgi:hypothetical protein